MGGTKTVKRRRSAALAGALLTGTVLAGSAGSRADAPPAPAWAESFSGPVSRWDRRGAIGTSRVRVPGGAVLRLRALGPSGGSLSRRLPASSWALSLKLVLPASTKAELGFGPRAGHRLALSRTASGSRIRIRLGSGRVVWANGRGPSARSGAVHVQAVQTRRAVRISVNRRRLTLPGRAAARLVVAVRKGNLWLDDVLATAASGRRELLLHRLSYLHGRVQPRGSLVGADRRDRLYLGLYFWTRGFLAGALWHAADLTPGSDLFRDFALDRTLAGLGYESKGSHDLGFVYENSSLAAYRRLCRTGRQRVGGLCKTLRSSALAAAARLMRLARSNRTAGTIPTRESNPLEVDTIVDSMMNLPLLYWASSATGNPTFRKVAARHAARVASLLVRPDGSTAQSVHFDRFTGKVLRIHTHQGISAASTWARGQAWAVYGFTTSAAALRDPALLAVAERAAARVAARLPAAGVPPFDYDAPLRAPRDTSAGVITAAGLFRLAALCRRWAGACSQPERWRPLAERMLSGALARVSPRPPLGFLGGQVGVYGGPRWDDNAELVYGLNYALEAVTLAGRTP